MKVYIMLIIVALLLAMGLGMLVGGAVERATHITAVKLNHG